MVNLVAKLWYYWPRRRQAENFRLPFLFLITRSHGGMNQEDSTS